MQCVAVANYGVCTGLPRPDTGKPIGRFSKTINLLGDFI